MLKCSPDQEKKKEGRFEAIPSPKTRSSLIKHKKSYAPIHLEWAEGELIIF